jgi:hypothetical protein
MKRQILLALCVLGYALPAAAQMADVSMPHDAVRLSWSAPADGAAQLRARMLILRRIDPATIDEQTLHEIGLLLSSADPVDVSHTARAMMYLGPRARPYARRLQQIVSEEHCNMTGLGPGDPAGMALKKSGIPARPSGCLAWTKK